MVETIYRIPAIPPLPPLLRIALLTDLHGRAPAPVLASVRAHNPSLIAIAGDILYGSQPVDDKSPLNTQELVLPFLSACASLAPTFLSLGNHEWMLDEADLERIRATGVVVLDNDYQTISIDVRKVVVGGPTSSYVLSYRRYLSTLDDQERASTRYPKKETSEGLKRLRTASERLPDTAWLRDFAAADPDAFHVVISHHPEYFPLIPASVNLVLSGHTHNGQAAYYSFRRHRWQGLWAPGQGWLPKELCNNNSCTFDLFRTSCAALSSLAGRQPASFLRLAQKVRPGVKCTVYYCTVLKYSRGVYEGRLVVSAGLANTARVPRICNPTETVFIESPRSGDQDLFINP